MKVMRSLTLILVMLGLAGCSRMIGNFHKVPYDAPTQKHARHLLESALYHHPAPETFKGIGNIKITKDKHVEKGRIAWMASGSDKMRIELLTPYGQPWATFSSDGRHVYILVYSDQSFHKTSVSKTNLKRIISVSVRPEEIIALLSGRPPLLDYSFISLAESKTGPGVVLLLQEKWWGNYQKIYLDKTADSIRAIEVYDGSGQLTYKADFSWKTENDARIPYLLNISDGKDTNVQLIVNRHWTEVDISPSAFVLTPPGG